MLESYQEERIKLIKEILPLFGDNFVLKGGTALSLFYNLDRYSEDLDFDCNNNHMNFIHKLKKHKDFKWWNFSIKKDTDLVFRAMLDYGACSHLGAYPLKIEVSKRNKFFLQQNKLRYKNVNGVNVYELDELIKMKVTAFSGRDKIRDFYDLGFLLKTHPNKFSDEALFSIYEKISYAGVDELNLLLLDEIENHKLVSSNKPTINYAQDILEYIKELQTKADKMAKERQNSNSNDEFLQTRNNTQKNRLRQR